MKGVGNYIAFLIVCTLHTYIQSTAQTITTVAGTGVGGYSGDGGLAISAKLYYPCGVRILNNSSFLVADFSNSRIRKVNTTTGIITTIAGTGVQGYSGDGGLATNAQMYSPQGVCLDKVGNIYFADANNHRVRKIDTVTGIITTIAGNGTPAYSGDGGLATNAQLSSPASVFSDTSSNIYIGDYANQRIRKINHTTGIITTIAGTGTIGFSGDGGQATSAQLNYPSYLQLDTSGNIYFSDTYNNRIRRINASTGIITTIAGNGTAGYLGDGGLAINAEMNEPGGLSLIKNKSVLFADFKNNVIREIDLTSGIISTIAGTGSMGYYGDGGPATNAQFHYPIDLCLSPSGNLYIADQGNYVIRKISNAVSANEINFTSNIFLYPNPANEKITLSFKGLEIENTEVRIVDVFGCTVLRQTIRKKTEVIDVSDLISGVYFLNLTLKDGIISKKVVIQH